MHLTHPLFLKSKMWSAGLKKVFKNPADTRYFMVPFEITFCFFNKPF